jgi:hypothetical protein
LKYLGIDLKPLFNSRILFHKIDIRNPNFNALSNIDDNKNLEYIQNLIKAISDEIVYHPVSYKVLFGATADREVQATFKVTKNISSVVSDNDIKARVVLALNSFFALDNWSFGDTFYFTELATYVTNQLTPDITNFVIVPSQTDLYFGSLFEISCPSNKIFVNGATVDNIEIISGITGSNIRTVTGNAMTTISSNQNTTSANYGATN